MDNPFEDWDGTITERERAMLQAPSADALSHEQNAQQIFRSAAPQIAQAIVDLALGAGNEKVRLDASKYVADRALGRIGEARELEKTGEPWEDVYNAVTREPTAQERQSGIQVSR